jgi:predicted nucleic acid-binding protein
MRKNRDEALRRAAQMLAVRVYDALYVSLAP